jgi:hypothetical protein
VDESIILVIVDSIRCDSQVWTAMNRWIPISRALLHRMRGQDAEGRHHKGLVGLLVEVNDKAKLDDGELEEVQASIAKHVKVRGFDSSCQILTLLFPGT